LELSDRQPIFVGFKLDGTLRRQLQSIDGPDRRYVSSEESTYLRICAKDGDFYVGKVIEDRLTTDRIQDIRRNVQSLMQRLVPDARVPNDLDILVCVAPEASGSI
jgi:hypothetical protein